MAHGDIEDEDKGGPGSLFGSRECGDVAREEETALLRLQSKQRPLVEEDRRMGDLSAGPLEGTCHLHAENGLVLHVKAGAR